jgi:hypothetical protein
MEKLVWSGRSGCVGKGVKNRKENKENKESK